MPEFIDLASSIKLLNLDIDLKRAGAQRGRIINRLADLREREQWHQFAFLAFCFKIINPSITLDIDEEKMKTLLKPKQGIKNWHLFAELASELTIIDPKVDWGITDTDKKEIRKTLEDYRGKDEWRAFARLAPFLAILSAKNVIVDNQGFHLVFEKKKEVQEQMPDRPRVF